MKLKQALEKKKFVVTSEIQAPIDDSPEEIITHLERIRGRVDGVSVFEPEMEGIISDTVRMCDLLRKNRFEAIYQTGTRNKSRPQLEKDLLAAHEVGADNILVFTEDYRITGDSLQEMMFFHVDAGKVSSVLDHMKQGVTVEGKDLPAPVEFILGSGIDCGWGKNVPDLEKKEMEEMTRIGTGYFLTTPVFDVAQFEKFMKEVRGFGVPVIAEVMILKTAGMAQFLNRHLKSGLVPDWIIKKLASSPDKQKASIELFAETVKSLKDLCNGVHIITIGDQEKLRNYLDAAKLR